MDSAAKKFVLENFFKRTPLESERLRLAENTTEAEFGKNLRALQDLRTVGADEAYEAWELVQQLMQESPDEAWDLILQLLEIAPDQWAVAEIGAGVLEDFLQEYGPRWIPCILRERDNSRLVDALRSTFDLGDAQLEETVIAIGGRE